MPHVRSLHDLKVRGKRVLIRVDFNVPLDKAGHISDDTRIRASLPTIEYVINNGGTAILMSHFGRPKGKTPEYSLAPCAVRLSRLLDKPVEMAKDCIGPEVEQLVKKVPFGSVVLLENVRFYAAEEKPDTDPTFAGKLAKLGDMYVNDAFGSAHRAHSSTCTIAKYFPGNCAAGFLMEKEIAFLGEHLQNPQHPFYAIIGGAKVSTKIGVLKSLLNKLDAIFIGGGMAFTFYKAMGIPIGNSILEENMLPLATDIMRLCEEKGVKFFLPVDMLAATSFDNQANTEVVDMKGGIPEGYQGMDIGERTIALWVNELKKAKTVLWNGPVGVFEFPNFAKGTVEIAKALGSMTGAITIAGGGETVAAIQEANLTERFSHISTGGGASLEYIEKGQLPGITALETAAG